MKNIIDMIPGKNKSFSPKEYIRLNNEEKRNIKSCRFVPPTLGSSDFGKFAVILKHPVYSFDNGKTK